MPVNPALRGTGGLESRRLLGKTILDRSVAGLLLLLTGVWLLLIAVAVHLDTGGPVLGRERRLGRNGRPFWLLSFRCALLGVAPDDDSAPGEAVEEARVLIPTRTGPVLRRYGFDRLPRLINVVRGDMSLVGPPPQPPEVADEEGEGAAAASLPVRPGLIGLEEVRRRHGGRRTGPVDLEDYVRHYSVGVDLAVLGRALLTAMSSDGAR